MRFLLQMGFLSGLLYAASGCCCCCPDYCGNGYGGYGNAGASCQQNYNTVSTGGYQATAYQAGTANYGTASGTQQQSMMTGNYNGQSSMQTAQTPVFSSEYGNLCPCETTGLSAGAYMQDGNGIAMQGMPMDGIVYDASVVPTPVDVTPANTAANQIPKRQQGIETPVSQPKFGMPVGPNGQPLVPPSPGK